MTEKCDLQHLLRTFFAYKYLREGIFIKTAPINQQVNNKQIQINE